MEVVDLIKKIDISKSSGLDKISSRCLRDALLALSSQVTYIFQLSLKYSIFPDNWKIGTIVPLFKGDIKEDVSNYRPVSLLPIPGKILENIVHKHMVDYLENKNLLFNNQGGLRKNHSTLGSITSLTTDIFNAINNKEITMATFFDLKKAFDTVNHEILIKKLSNMGIKNNILNWISNYLKGRLQKTICNNKLSNVNKVICGVPQGSILGPLLFLVYINDVENIFCDVKFQLYADDTVVYCSGENISEVKLKMQSNIDKFVNWCNINKLTINTKKTKSMIFGSRPIIKSSNKDTDISINNEVLQNVPTYKYLGINLDQTLSYNYHLKNVINSISHKLYIFNKIRRFLDIKSSVIIYKSMILPYFDYGDSIWMFSNIKLLKKLDRLHYRGLRISMKCDRNVLDAKLLIQCNISDLDNRRLVHLRNFMFNRKLLCKPRDELSNRACTRSNDGPLFDIKKPNCEAYKRSICYSGHSDWNNLDPKIRNIDNMILFKRHQKSWLLNTYHK